MNFAVDVLTGDFDWFMSTIDGLAAIGMYSTSGVEDVSETVAPAGELKKIGALHKL